MKLTDRQVEVLAFMRVFQAENDNMPTMAQVGRHFGFRSRNAADEHFKALVRAGELERVAGQCSYRFRRAPRLEVREVVV